MKKLAALLLALMMTLTLAAATAETYTAGAYYTIDYPDTLTLNNTEYTDESTEDHLWLFMLYNEDFHIEGALTKASGYEGVSLYEATEAERDAYVDDTLEAFADDNIAYVEELTTVSGFPFYLYTMEDSDGAYYYAETIANGTSVNFYAYYDDATAELDEALLTTLAEILITLRPVDSDADTATAAKAFPTSAADATSGATTGTN